MRQLNTQTLQDEARDQDDENDDQNDRVVRLIRLETRRSPDRALDERDRDSGNTEGAEEVQRQGLKVQVKSALHDVDVQVLMNEDDECAQKKKYKSPEDEKVSKARSGVPFEELLVARRLFEKKIEPFPEAVEPRHRAANLPKTPASIEAITKHQECQGE